MSTPNAIDELLERAGQFTEGGSIHVDMLITRAAPEIRRLQAQVADVKDKFKALHQEWLTAGKRADMNHAMDALAGALRLDYLTLNDLPASFESPSLRRRSDE